MRIIDPYDDAFKAIGNMASKAEVPEFIKTASILDDEERSNLPDHCFALIIRDGDEIHRKFACVDKGNTAVNAIYLMKHAHELPEEARRKAASNLCLACSRFGLEVPARLEKMASTEKALVQTDSAGLFVKGVELEKKAEWDAWVDATNKWPTHWRKPESVDSVSFRGRELSLDSFSQVKEAADRFETEWRVVHPKERRSAALGIQKRAAFLGIHTGPVLRKYAGRGYRPDEELFHALKERAQRWPEGLVKEAAAIATSLFEKKAELAPDEYADALGELDVATGLDNQWGNHVSDPWEATIADPSEEEEAVWDLDTGQFTASELAELISRNYANIEEAFGSDLAEGLAEDPVVVFESLPRDVQNAITSMGGTQ